jgi:3-oxoacyl-[acyl-carrier protein] reductase
LGSTPGLRLSSWPSSAGGSSLGGVTGGGSLTSGGQHGFPSEVTYGAAKAALESYTLSAASELAKHGVTANLVLPPVTDTGWVNDELRALVASDPYLVHVAQPDDVAKVVAWLCSDDAGLVTGTRVLLR